MLIKSFLQADRYNEIRTYAVDNDTTFVPVKNFQVVYGIPKDSTNLAYEDYYTSDYYLVASGGGDAAYFITLLVIAAFACFMCSRRVWKMKNDRIIFQMALYGSGDLRTYDVVCNV